MSQIPFAAKRRNSFPSLRNVSVPSGTVKVIVVGGWGVDYFQLVQMTLKLDLRSISKHHISTSSPDHNFLHGGIIPMISPPEIKNEN